MARIPFTTLSVDAFPALRMLISTPRWPSCRTIFVWKAAAIADRRYIAQVKGRTVHLFDRNHAQLVERPRSRIRANVVFFTPIFAVPKA